MKFKSRLVLILTILMLMQSVMFGGAALAAGTNLPNVTEYGLYNYVDSNDTAPTASQVKYTGNDGVTYNAWPWEALTQVPCSFDSNVGIGIKFAVNVATPTQWDQNATRLNMYDASGNAVAINVFRLGDGTNTDVNRNYIFVVPQVTLQPSSTYKIVIDAEITANNTMTAGKVQQVDFTTAGEPTAPTDVSLSLNKPHAIAGASVTASGTAEPDKWVSIQVQDSGSNIVFFDAVKSTAGGSYSDIFKVPAVSAGSLTVQAGYGGNVASASLNVIPEITADVSISGDGSNKNLAITSNSPASVAVTVPQGVSDASLNVAELLSSNAGGVSTSALPALNISSNVTLNSSPVEVKVTIPAGTVVSAAAGWDGTINMPTVQAVDSVTVTLNSGKTATVKTVIEVGCGDIALEFSQAVKLVIPGQAGQYAGYCRGGRFTPITTALTATSQAGVDAELLAKGVQDGKQNSGSDLVIWTKHFTSFVTYTQSGGSDDPTGGNGDGSGANAGSTNFWVEDFTVLENSSSSYTLRFDLSNGMDREIPGNLSKVHVYKKSDRTLIPYSSYNYIKQGTNDNPPKIRRLELTYDSLFKKGESYLVEIDPDFTANNGNTFGTMYTTEFTIGTSEQEDNSPGVFSFGSAGGTLDGENATIVIPEGAFNSEIKISVVKVSDISALPITNGNKILGTVVEITADRTGEFNQPVIITLRFDQSLVDLEKNRVSICWLDETAGKWNELENVKVDTTTGTVSGGINHFTKFAVMEMEKTQPEEVPTLAPVINLNDIKGHWAQAQIEKLVAAGAISGYPDSTFKPDQSISRAEFATVLVKAFKLEAKNGKIFADTAEHWAQDAIATVEALGIASGYSEQYFGADDPITREQMAVMISKAAKLTPVESGKIFSDQEQISEWARDAVNRASGHQIISGYPDNSFQPKADASRAQAVTVIARAL